MYDEVFFRSSLRGKKKSEIPEQQFSVSKLPDTTHAAETHV